MGATRTPTSGPPPTAEQIERMLSVEVSSPPMWWSNGPGDTYGWHDHPYHKVLFCSEGSITFHLRDGDVELVPGDRLDIEPATEHSATVGPAGVTCVEASK
jgi:mannose-6-phosphate isomerase-like protein (cupin superfamily)